MVEYLTLDNLSIIPAIALGYLASKTVSHPSSRVRKKLPNIRVKRVQVFPVIRIFLFGRVVHIHHYLYLSFMLVISFFVSMNILNLIVVKCFLVGAIAHGLLRMPKGHRKIIYRDFSLESLTSPADRK